MTDNQLGDALAAGRVRVHRFATWDPSADKFRISQRMGTADAIARLGGVLVNDRHDEFRLARPQSHTYEEAGDIVVSGSSAVVDRADLEPSRLYAGLTAPGFWDDIRSAGPTVRRVRAAKEGRWATKDPVVALVQGAHKNLVIPGPTSAPVVFDNGREIHTGRDG